jgi:hypothetical protein
MPVEELECDGMERFYVDGWVLVQVDHCNECHTSWVFPPDTQVADVVEEVLGKPQEGE